MRFLIPAILAVAVSGCTASSKLDVLDLQPSSETVSSIVPAPVPSEDVGGEGEVMAMAGGTPVSPARAALFPPEVMPEEEVAFVAPPGAVSSGRPKVYNQKFDDAKPVSFGRAAPKHFPVHGVDVSRWQGDIDWHTLRKQGANFAFIKATEGIDHVDDAFRRNWKAAAEAGVPRGAYHFFYWCRTARDQAKWFIRNVPKVKGALPPVLDVEWNAHSQTCRHRPTRQDVLEKMQVFLDALERHYGQRPIIYTSPDFYKDNLRGQFRDYPFWLRSVAAHPDEIYSDRDWAFWQYSGTGQARGVPENIDLNVFNGSERGWYEWMSRRAH
ncbi:glycoside hydrolase family 25 protein [Oricola nitratireducens]|uniref:glycoside hydrolase family 25 protein n=1 Tax=Oricola nitratireducens TaxID=2775868 RepID=UPI001866FE9C|nr:GH25 family lysozyme [Oricola nitratireducens]